MPRTHGSSPAIRKVTNFLEGGGLHSLSSLEERGFDRMAIGRAVAAEQVIQFARGIYCSPSSVDEQGVSLAALTLLMPHSVICLLSATHFHGLSDEDPSQTWLAVERGRSGTRTSTPNLPTQVVWWQPSYFADGIQTVRMAGVNVRVTDPARTVTDMVRSRRKLGDEPAMKTFQDYLRKGLLVSDVLSRARAIGFLEDVEPFCRLAETLREDMPTSMMRSAP